MATVSYYEIFITKQFLVLSDFFYLIFLIKELFQ